MKDKKAEMSDLEKKQKQIKRKRFFRWIMTVVEVAFIIVLGFFLKTKYDQHSKKAHQLLIYEANPYTYRIERKNDQILVEKINEDKIVEDAYSLQFSKNQMTIIKGYFDTLFKLKDGEKTITMDKITTDIGKNTIHSIIHNDEGFLKTDTYNQYELDDYEQKSEYDQKGYKIIEEGDKKYLIIAGGQKKYSGYLMSITVAHKKNDEVTFYVTTTPPEQEERELQTNPMLRILLKEDIPNIKVFELDTGEEYINYNEFVETNS